MSDERKKGRKKQLQQGPWRKVITAALIVAAFAAAYLLGIRKRASRLDHFAQCLASKQVKMYGAFWCPHCAEEKETFGPSFQYVPYVECGIEGSRAEQPVCLQAGIKNFPTWQFGNGERTEGTLPLQTLAQKSGCSLP